MSVSVESEVASYVLAYLLQNNFTSSANSFLQECNVLPSKTLIVLPETPLHVVVAEHNARLNAKVLVNTLGSEPAWLELWRKLQTTLNQIRCLSEELNSHHFQPSSKMKVLKVIGDKAKKCVSQNTEQVEVVSVSPHKRKQVPRRKVLHTSPSLSSTTLPLDGDPVPSNSPTIQHVLDNFLDDAAFPGKLADIINQCVSSDMCGEEISSDISSETLEHILNVTLSEPTLGVLPVSSTSRPVEVTVLDKCRITTDPMDNPSPNTSCDPIGPSSLKRPRLDESNSGFPSDQDIDKFLDQIHQ